MALLDSIIEKLAYRSYEVDMSDIRIGNVGPIGLSGDPEEIIIEKRYENIIGYEQFKSDLEYINKKKSRLVISFSLENKDYEISYSHFRSHDICFTIDPIRRLVLKRFIIEKNVFLKHMDEIAQQIATESLFEKI
jgi:hypothetical protein